MAYPARFWERAYLLSYSAQPPAADASPAAAASADTGREWELKMLHAAAACESAEGRFVQVVVRLPGHWQARARAATVTPGRSRPLAGPPNPSPELEAPGVGLPAPLNRRHHHRVSFKFRVTAKSAVSGHLVEWDRFSVWAVAIHHVTVHTRARLAGYPPLSPTRSLLSCSGCRRAPDRTPTDTVTRDLGRRRRPGPVTVTGSPSRAIRRSPGQYSSSSLTPSAARTLRDCHGGTLSTIFQVGFT